MTPTLPAAPPQTEDTLTGTRLTSGYGERAVLTDVDIELLPGQIHGIIGPNGAGKTTLLATLAALHRSTRGSVLFGGTMLREMSSRHRAHVRSLVPQSSGSDAGFTVRTLVELGRYSHRGRFAPLSTEDHQAVDDALARTGTTDLADRPLDELSGGQRQLAAIAKALAQQSAFLLLDEPLSALDPRHQLEILRVLHACAADGTGVAIVLHDLTLAARLCDRLTVVADGRVYAHGEPREVITPTMLAEVYGVSASVRSDPDTGTPAVTLLAPIP